MIDRYLSGRNAALLTDLYELTMAQAYVAEGMHEPATFSLFVRDLPETRNYLLACGIEDCISFIESWRFSDEDLSYLDSLGQFSQPFLRYLQDFRFTGDVYAVPEGTPVFAQEPILEVVAPIAQAQLLETAVMNQVHSQTVLASKAARVVEAAAGRPVLDFGLRRIHGADGGVKAARAYHIAGIGATSNMLAGRLYGVPVAGTMAHSYIQAHDDELEAFRAFAHEFPETVLLVDTYDTLDGVRHVIRLASELGEDFRVRGIRLDSGDLAELARQSRAMLDDAGLNRVQIFASGGLDETSIARLVEDGAPIDGFGVGTKMGVSEDAPSLDIAYKLTEYAGEPRMKLSTGKRTLPGRKQIYRQRNADGGITHDVLGLWNERIEGETLIRHVVENGQRLASASGTPDGMRARCGAAVQALPETIRGLAPARPPFEVRLSEALLALDRELSQTVS